MILTWRSTPTFYPLRLDDLELVRPVRARRIEGLDDDAEALAVAPQPETLAVAPVETDGVEHGVGLVRIVVEILGRVFLVVVLRLRPRRCLEGLADTDIDRVDDFLPVDRVRHGHTEIALAEDFAQCRDR